MAYGKGSQAEIQQRQKSNLKHGVFAYEHREEQALDVTGRCRLAELSEIVQTRPGVIGLLQEQCVRAIMMTELIEAYIVEQKQEGKSIESIPILSRLPAYQNSAQRCIQTLLHVMKDDPNTLDAAKVLEAVKNHGKE